ncbi:hypothetical protein [Ferviditalea candida]|uniref:Transposase n=1 Tax=Ferviditalea candida TaxID=3108399 RepID=A0ABU5ZHJ0_9BACL|nr:hypothetical protein [Paenibacillaceae bacterium T2]
MAKWAKDEFRSVNAIIEFLLRDALAQEQAGSRPPKGLPGPGGFGRRPRSGRVSQAHAHYGMKKWLPHNEKTTRKGGLFPGCWQYISHRPGEFRTGRGSSVRGQWTAEAL